MTYPISSEVSAGQPTAAAHYNNLRSDALYLGQLPADSKHLADFLARFAANIKLTYLATNRIRVLYNLYHPAVVMVGGCMLKASADIDLPANSFTGAAAKYYVHAVRTAGSAAFTLSVNTTTIETDTSRVIGTCYWDGSKLASISSYYDSDGLPEADYDSGWFACTYNSAYTLTHGFSSIPRIFMLYHCPVSDGSTEMVLVTCVFNGTQSMDVVGFGTGSFLISTANNATAGTCYSTRRQSASGYYRLLAWK